MKLNKEFYSYLFNYWKHNYINICAYCTNCIECRGKECPKYTTFTPDEVTIDGKLVSKETNPNLYNEMTCEDFDFGTCDMLLGTPCENCIENNESGFKWNGTIPKED